MWITAGIFEIDTISEAVWGMICYHAVADKLNALLRFDGPAETLAFKFLGGSTLARQFKPAPKCILLLSVELFQM